MASLQISPYGRTSRIPRRPQHTFNISARPFEIVPFFIAPVLPGETLKNMLFQSRVVTDPIKDPLVGWWCEMYFFYIKHRDLNERDVLTNMMIDPTVTAPLMSTGWLSGYVYPNGVAYTDMCMRRVVETYFRETGEAWNISASAMGYPQAQISQMTALESALLDSAYTAGTADDLVVGADDTIAGEELSKSWLLWQQYRAANITHLSYEEYLATYGIPLPQGSDSLHRPELVRYVKEWSYPVNTVDPVSGSPSSAVSWALSERADKERFFREPGFLFGVVCIRPKCYLAKQKGSVVCALTDALAWLPAVMGDNPEYSVRKFAAGTGPYADTAAAYRVDLKDLFLYGEQFCNRYNVQVPAWANQVSLPATTMQKKYPLEADVSGLFKTPTGTVKMDGVVSLNVLGMQTDTTPTTAPGTF